MDENLCHLSWKIYGLGTKKTELVRDFTNKRRKLALIGANGPPGPVEVRERELDN